jgi:hypothetical protein
MLTFAQFISEEVIRPKNSLGLSRDEMPQIRSFDVPDFLAFLSHHGVSHHAQQVKATTLKPVQSEINAEKVRTLDTTAAKKPMLVSSDGYIMDGHHRWLRAVWDDELLDVIKLSMKIRPLIELAKQYPKVLFSNVNHFHTQIAA